MTVRDFTEADAPGVAALLRGLEPPFIITAESVAHQFRARPVRAHPLWLIAEIDGEIAGFADAHLRLTAADPGIAKAWVAVRERDRGRGVGSELLERAVEHDVGHGAHTLSAWAWTDEGVGFAERRGFVPTRTARHSTLDVARARVDEPTPPEGFRVVALRELLDRPRDLHRVFNEAELDVPGDFERKDLDYDEWRATTLESPLLDLDASMNVLEGDDVVSFAWLELDREGGRGHHELTGTLRAYRGRGLATLAKVAAVRWCAANGIRELLTANDVDNAPMLAINERLGYRPTTVSTDLEKRLRPE